MARAPGAVLRTDHSVTLKVMRLRKPEIFFPFQPYSEPSDLIPEVTPCKELSNVLTLPKDFGSIFVGETLSSYLSLYNHSSTGVKNVHVKVQLTAAQLSTTLLDGPAIPQLGPRSSKGFVVEQSLSESGDHTLVCTVQYYDEGVSEVRSFRKVFRFPVSNPLHIKGVRIYTLKDHIFVLLELQNLMTVPMFLDTVTLDPSPGYGLLDHSPHSEDPAGEPAMDASEIRRFLFDLVPKSGAPPPLVNGKTGLGKIEIRWKTHFGQAGHLVTNTIEHRPSDKAEVELSVSNLPDIVAVDSPFCATLSVRNNSSREMDLALHLCVDKLYPLLVTGPLKRPIGVVPPQSSLALSLNLAAASLGLINLAGLEVRDTRGEKTYTFGTLGSLFVE
eukprot:RCo045796